MEKSVLIKKYTANRSTYETGYDVYHVPETNEGVGVIYKDLKEKGGNIDTPPSFISLWKLWVQYKDIFDHLIGFRQIQQKELFFRKGVVWKGNNYITLLI